MYTIEVDICMHTTTMIIIATAATQSTQRFLITARLIVVMAAEVQNVKHSREVVVDADWQPRLAVGVHHRWPLENARHADATLKYAALALAQPVEIRAVFQVPAQRDAAVYVFGMRAVV